MKRGRSYDWIPLWVKKWLWGSTRHELKHDERAIFIDLLALASQDDGYIRASETIPYPLYQLAGMLQAEPELVQRTIDKCLREDIKKLERKENGTLYIINWEEYCLAPGYKRAVTASTKADTASPKAVTAATSLYKYKSQYLSLSFIQEHKNVLTEEQIKPSNNARRLVAELIILMERNDPRSRTLRNLTERRREAWEREAWRIVALDGYTFEQALWLLRWCQEDAFWRGNILSMPKFREKFDQLKLHAARKHGPSAAYEWLKEKREKEEKIK